MRLKSRIYLAIACLAIFPLLTLSGVQHEAVFRTVNIKNGLSQDAVNCMIKDQKGFIWIGTFNGLNRYDGYEFKIFRHSDLDSNSLSNNAIVSMIEDHLGYIWIGTYHGLNRFDPRTERFERFYYDSLRPNTPSYNRVHNMVMDAYGKIWCSTWGGGLFSLDPESIEFESHRIYELEGLSDHSKIVSQILPIGQNELWVCTNGDGVLRYNFLTKEYKQYLSPEACPKEGVSKAWHIMHIEAAKYLVCADQNIIYTFDAETGSFTPLSELVGKQVETSLTVSGFMKGFQNDIWIATHGDGVYRYVLDTNELIKFKNILNKPQSLANDRVLSLNKTEDGILWFGTSSGLSFIDPHYKKFTAFTRNNLPEEVHSTETYSFLDYSEDEVLVSFFGSGIQLYNTKTNAFSDPPRIFSPESIGDKHVITMFRTREGHILMGSNNGLVFIDKNMKRIKKYVSEFDRLDQAPNFLIRCIEQDDQGVIWVGSVEGLIAFDMESEEFELYKPYSESSSESLENLIWTIRKDHNGQLWVGTDGGGLCLFDPLERKYVRKYTRDIKNEFSISDNRVLTIHEDTKKRLWVGTSSGLNCFDQEKGTFKKLTQADGIRNDVVFSLIEDDLGHIWFATAKTLVDFDPESWIFSEYDHTDGIQEKEFTNNGAFKLQNGELLFGGLGGFNRIYPGNISKNLLKPQIALTGIEVLNTSIEEKRSKDGKPLIATSIPFTDTLILHHSDNFIHFKFAALNYSLPSKNQYEYKLDNFDDQWIKSGSSRFASYTKLPPGEYVFRVRASNNDLVWNVDGISIFIKIKPPFWNTAWAKIVFILSLLLIIALIMKVRTNRLEKQKRVLEDQVYDRTIDLSQANTLLEEQREEIMVQNEKLEERQIQIESQNKELESHRNNLEEIVKIRTRDLQIALKKAEVSEKLKASFLSNMSHEIRTPMNAIIGFSEMLDDEDLTDAERSQFVEIIKNNSRDLLILINDILDLSQIESGHIQARKEKFKLEDLLNDIADQYAHRIQQQGLALKLSYDQEGSTYIHSDPSRIKQVLLNLIENALKFTQEGHIELGFTTMEKQHPESTHIPHNGHYFKLYVKDTGKGIPEEQTKIVFERFRKLEESHSKLFRGAGLGLAISERLVNLLGGDIWVDSVLGEYSNFQFTLPAFTPDQASYKGSIRSKTEKREPAAWENKVVLVAEDEWANYHLIESILKKTGAELLWAKDGQEALDIFEKHDKIDIGIIDIKMPMVDGFEFINRLSERHQPNKIPPLLACTAFTIGLDKEEFFRNGFEDYLYKPFRPDELMKKIEYHISRPAPEC